jgi:hypothetical protein
LSFTDVAGSNFDWTSQLRYYWEEANVKASLLDPAKHFCLVNRLSLVCSMVVQVRMVTSTVDYGCEYIGNTERLVFPTLQQQDSESRAGCDAAD